MHFLPHLVNIIPDKVFNKIFCRCHSKFNQGCSGTFFESFCWHLREFKHASYFVINLDWVSPRLLQWMLQISGATSYMGCIGKDKFGEEMKKNSKRAGVNVSFFFYSTVFLLCIFFFFVELKPMFFIIFYLPSCSYLSFCLSIIG